jgi:hypothetical protein
MFQPENSFVFRKALEREVTLSGARVMRWRLSARPLTQRGLMSHSFIVESSFKCLKKTSSATLSISRCVCVSYVYLTISAMGSLMTSESQDTHLTSHSKDGSFLEDHSCHHSPLSWTGLMLTTSSGWAQSSWNVYTVMTFCLFHSNFEKKSVAPAMCFVWGSAS